MSNRYFPLLVLLFLAGCSSQIKVYDEAGVEQKGVPVRSPVLVEITTTVEYEISPTVPQDAANYALIVELCKPTVEQSTSFLPLGDINYVSYVPATFAKSEFTVDYLENGGVKSISVNSDPAATTESAANLLDAVLPFTALKAPAAPAAPAALIDTEALRKASCIKKSTKITSICERELGSQSCSS